MTDSGKERLLEAAKKFDARESTHEEWTRVLIAESSFGVYWKVVISLAALVCTVLIVYSIVGATRGGVGSTMEECILLNVKSAKSDLQTRVMYKMCEDRFRPAR